jgi:hypothetical protein
MLLTIIVEFEDIHKRCSALLILTGPFKLQQIPAGALFLYLWSSLVNINNVYS